MVLWQGLPIISKLFRLLFFSHSDRVIFTERALVPEMYTAINDVLDVGWRDSMHWSVFRSICRGLLWDYRCNKDEWEYPLTHWIMMGLNEKSDGGYMQEDVAYTATFETRKERTEENVRVILARLRCFGASDYIQFIFSIKCLAPGGTVVLQGMTICSVCHICRSVLWYRL